MASIGKLAVSALSTSIENTAALANINFDFSLYKIEAPKEFNALGNSLTSQRREAAEQGILHQTARRLGSLFHDLLPQTPKLVQAYGQRASEISQQPDANPQDKKSNIYGAFSAHIGLDAASIWAGATSGPSAIAVHLLACMLARTWSGPEAISIWWELVTERKKQIDNGYQSGLSIPVATIMAAQQELRRDHLADWDASARSWLRSADRAKKWEQKQLLLIVNNVKIAVSNTAATYPNVLEAWKTAMTGLENILSGVPQRVQNGAVLLAFTSWHIFPDIIMLGEKMTEVNFRDPLVPTGAVVEIGLRNAHKEDPRGVFWSLSLAHLRYYGSPVPVSKSASYDENRVSMDQLHIIALGSIISNWDTGRNGNNFAPIFSFLRSIATLTSRGHKQDHNTWIHGLVTAIEAIDGSTGIEAKYASLLFSYGRHQGKALIPAIPAYLGLGDYTTLMRLSTSAKGKIAILRDVAQNLKLPENLCIIKYRNKIQGDAVEYASVFPNVKSLKRAREGAIKNTRYSRWLYINQESLKYQGAMRAHFLERQNQISQELEDCHHLPFPIKCTTNLSKLRADSKKWQDGISTFLSPDSEHTIFQGHTLIQSHPSLQNDRISLLNEPDTISESNVGVWTDVLLGQKFFLLVGDSSEAGLFVAAQALGEPRFKNMDISNLNIIDHIANASGLMPKASLKALRALTSAASVYRSYPDASLSLRVCSRPLHKAFWIPPDWRRHRQDEVFELSRAEKFSCLAFFETGTCDIRPDVLKSVMAMSTGDTLYISECLLSDPAIDHDHSEIRRAIGNVGRPGISMLISPGNTERRKEKTDSWMLIDPSPFNGVRRDSFASTSMHLNFTGYELPIGENNGGRDVEAALVEASISILHSGEWVADVDLLSQGDVNGGLCLFRNQVSNFYRFVKLPERQRWGDQMECQHGIDRYPAELPLNSVDNWDELLAEADMAGIVRAHGNKIARIATAAVSLSIGRTVHVLPENCCLQCLVDYFGGEGFFKLTNSVIIIM